MDTSAVRSRYRMNGRQAQARRGQGTVEYILIVGLILITVTVSLLIFRNSVGSFTQKLFSWFDAQGEKKKDAPPPEEPSDPLNSLVGTWCMYSINPDGTETYHNKAGEFSRSESDDVQWRYDRSTSQHEVQSTGSDTFQIDHTTGSFTINSDGTLSYGGSMVLRRCG